MASRCAHYAASRTPSTGDALARHPCRDLSIQYGVHSDSYVKVLHYSLRHRHTHIRRLRPAVRLGTSVDPSPLCFPKTHTLDATY